MKKFYSIALTLTILGLICPASSFSGIIRLQEGENHLLVNESNYAHFMAEQTVASFQVQDIKVPSGIFSRVSATGFNRFGSVGSPELPVNSELIEMPVGAVPRVIILEAVYQDFQLKDIGGGYSVYPMQAPVPKSGPVPGFAMNQSAYQASSFNAGGLVTVELTGTLRGVEIGRLNICPFQYDFQNGTLRVYERISFEVIYDGSDVQATIDQKQKNYSPAFSPVYRSLLNYRQEAAAGRDTVGTYPVKYVIVADPMFEAALQPFVQWKTRKGFTVVEAYTDDPEVGNTTFSIKAYLQGLYNNGTPEDPAPSFVLFVGDIAQIPTWTGQAAGHVTDLFYCEYTGDFYPEIYYGRFSATSVAQLQPQIDKTLMYEQYTMPDPSYLDSVVMIAGMDGTFGPTHANGQINYGTENYFNDTLGIYSHTYLYPESGSLAADIRLHISNGVTFANYTAHGSPSGWADPSFLTSHIPAMTNAGKYGLLVGNCCSTSEYQVDECFGEALLRAVDKGAVGYIGASNSTYWDEDYYWGVGVGPITADPPAYEATSLGAYDRAFHTHGETFDEWYTTSGQMIFAGNLAVTEGSGGMAQYYWEAYCIMGDPSLMVYFSEPPALSVSYDPLIPLGSATFAVTTEPYAYAALSKDNVLLGAALAGTDGIAIVPINGSPDPGNADVVVTKQNAQPFSGTVLIANPEGPYVMMNEYILHDSPGNNGLIEGGEDVLVDMELRNWGNSDAVNVMATLSTDDPFVTVLWNEQEYGTVPANDSVMEYEAFYFGVTDSIPDQHSVFFDVLIEDGTREAWNSSFTINLCAPVLAIGNMSVVDTADGNGNHRLDAGEAADIIITLLNSGHSDALSALALLTSESPDISITLDSITADTLFCGGFFQAVFSVQVGDSVPAGTIVPLELSLAAGPYQVAKDFFPPVGLIVDDFETGDFSAFTWIPSGNLPWLVQSDVVYEGSYAATSGDINDSQNSILSLDMNVLMDDSISFYRRVSCEDDLYNNDYDWLAFYIDDVEMERWDGELGWLRVSYPVTEGTHTFKWVYHKDYSVSSGSDAGWIDYIVFPAVPSTVGVPEDAAKSNLNFGIFPNPAGDQIKVSYTLPADGLTQISIYNLLGKEVNLNIPAKNEPSGHHQHTLYLNSLDNGVYFISFRWNDRQITRKMIISH